MKENPNKYHMLVSKNVSFVAILVKKKFLVQKRKTLGGHFRKLVLVPKTPSTFENYSMTMIL